VPTFVQFLRCGVLLISAISTALADPLLPEFGRRASGISLKARPICATRPQSLASQ
jgi:hypothetical protein